MVVSALTVLHPIDDPMKPYLADSLIHLYRLLLKVYPPAYRAEFADEMYDTFTEGIAEAQSQGKLARFILRELRDTPRVLAHAYWYGWLPKLQNGIQTLQDVASASDLPPVPPDGRESWRQVLWEMSLFLAAGIFLIFVTYLQPDGVPPGWQRSSEIMGRLIVPVTVTGFLVGLVRGLPRWSYPYGGLLLGYHTAIAGQTGLWLFLFLMMTAAFILALAAILTDPQPSLLPAFVRRIGQSLSVDWTRLSFFLYGAMPLVVAAAFDDSHFNNRTPYLGLSVLAMIAGALLYCRSRAVSLQIAALLLGITLSIWGALMDKITFADGLMNWIVVSSEGSTGTLWIFRLWIQWTILILLPGLYTAFGRMIRLNRAV